jgi:hypothetical protein
MSACRVRFHETTLQTIAAIDKKRYGVMVTHTRTRTQTSSINRPIGTASNLLL